MSSYCPPTDTRPQDAITQADDCCAVPAAGVASAAVANSIQDCPSCGRKGKTVDTQTVKAMLAISLKALRSSGYRFCRTPDCRVVYFSTDGEQVFRESDLREVVHQKHPTDDDVFVCYCFRHTPGTIRAELLERGTSTVVQAINAGIKAEQCACDVRNPQGSCCLGNVRAVVKQVQAELQPFAVPA